MSKISSDKKTTLSANFEIWWGDTGIVTDVWKAAWLLYRDSQGPKPPDFPSVVAARS